MSKISVVVPTYKRSEMLDETLHSIRAQTYTDLEIIVCDDVSDAPTERVIAIHTNADPRVVHKRNERPLPHQQGTIFMGLCEATGDFVAVLEDDNTWDASFLTELAAAMTEHPEAVLAFCDHWIVDAAGQIDSVVTDQVTQMWKRDALTPGLHRPAIRIALADRSIALTSATLIRRSAIDMSDFPEEVGASSDLWLLSRVVRKGGGAWYTPKRLARYRVHSDSITSIGGLAWARSSAYTWQRLLDDDALVEIRAQLVRRSARALTHLGTVLIREGQRTEARHVLKTAINRELAWRPIVAWMLTFAPTRLAQRVIETLSGTRNVKGRRGDSPD